MALLGVVLAPQALAGTWVVTKTADTNDGTCNADCSLREAIAAADQDATAPVAIHFAIPGGGVQEVSLDGGLGDLPPLTRPMTVDGTSEPGLVSPVGITLRAGQAGGSAGLLLAAGSGGSVVRGLAIVGFQSAGGLGGGLVVDSNGNTIAGNYLGVDASATTVEGNDEGIVVHGNGNTIGGAAAADRNVVSGNLDAGVFVQGNGDNFTPDGNEIAGNYIGVLPDGKTAAGNTGAGVWVLAATNTAVGGPDQAHGNVIAANGFDQVFLGNYVQAPASAGSKTAVRNNLIGLAADRSLVPNGSANGIDIEDAGSNVVADNVIAGGYQGVDICASPANQVVRNVIGSSTADAGGPDFGVANEGISMEPSAGACPNNATGLATGNVIGGNAADGNTVTHSQLHNIAVDGDGNTVSHNTLRGTKGGPNIEVSGSDNAIGPANVVTGATTSGGQFPIFGAGIEVGAGTGNTVTRNSISGNDQLGIDLVAGGVHGVTANDGSDADTGPNGLQNFPVLASAAFGTGSLTVAGTLDSAPGTYRVELFQSPSCDPSGNGQGAGYLGSVDVTVAAGPNSFSGTFATSSPEVVVTATATAADGSTSEFSPCVTATGAPGALSGALTQAVNPNVDVTGAGPADWAVWGYGLPTGDVPLTALAPTVTKVNGGREISDLTQVNPSGTPPRGFAFGSGVPFGFDWSDGTPAATASGAKAGLTAPKLGEGFSFTVPADTTPRTLTIWTSAHYADGHLTAHLSDGSAADYSATLHAVAGQFQLESGENVPAVFTLQYAAAGAGRHLTVTWEQTANNGCDGCDDIVIYAAALSGGGNTTGATANLTSAPSVGISGSNDALSDLPLRAFEPARNGTSPAPINGLPINGLPINGLPINGLPINGLPINGLPINGLPINGLPINGLPINGLPINGLPINGLPINGLELSQSWTDILKGTALEAVPLQTITLRDVFALNPRPAAVQNLTLGDLELAGSDLGKITIGALALGSTPINGLPAAAANSIESQLQAWCNSVVAPADAGTSCTAASLGTASLFALGLAGAPINGLPINGLPMNGLPINGLPINGLPINGLDLSASPINGLPINGLPINGLGNIVDCTTYDCTGKTLGDAAADGAIKQSATILDLLNVLLATGSPVRTTLTLGDVLGLLIKRADVPWESLSPRLLSVFDPSRPTLDLTAGFTLQGTGQPAATVKVTLPDGFDFDPGSAQLVAPGFGNTPLPDPAADGTSSSWTLPNLTVGTPYSVEFKVRSGTAVGPAQATETVTSGSASQSSVVSFDVTDSFQGNDTVDTAQPITPDQNVELSAVAAAKAVDYYKVTLPPAGTRLQVHLTNLAADYDLALYSSQTTSVRTSPTDGAPLQDGMVADQSINLQGGTNAQLAPTALQDVPDPGIPLVQVSANRGTDDEDVGLVSPGGGTAYIAVFGYNGASSTQPYTLRVTTRAPQQITCPARSFAFDGQGTSGAVPAISSLPANLNTLILVNEKRIGDTYGTAAETSVVSSLSHLAGDTSLGVSGAVVPVESLPGIDYGAWDANPCGVDAANAIANTIADQIDAVKAARPSLKYVVFAGGDDEIPFFRIPDLSRIANENGFAGQFGQNEYYGALGSSNLLTDDPYLDTRPIPASGRQLFVPDLVGGRLVEKPSQIVGAVGRFESSNGTLRSSTAFVSGYDFVTDGSRLVQSRLSSILGSGSVRTLISDTWSKSTLLGTLGAFPVGGPAAINDWNGHYDNHQALPADGDQSNLVTTDDLIGGTALSGGIFFTMGCHAGFQTTDAIVGAGAPDKLDWAEYFAGTGTSFVGNTGFGLGNTDSVAFSEELMAGLAGHLDGSLSIGEALARAKQDYYLSRAAFSSYDEKTLSEAELYGLPMYGVGTAPSAITAAAEPAVSPDPVLGSSSSTSPSESALTTLTGSTQAAPFSVVPVFSAQQNGLHGSYFTNAGQVQAPNYRPLQPYVTLPATRSGLTAHGVLIDGLSSEDHTPFNPDNVRPTLDLTANEPEPQFTEEAWPTKVPTLVSLDDSNGRRQSLNLTTGQFFTDSATHQGVERLWKSIAGRVTYSSSADFTPPSIDSINAYVSNGVVGFTGSFSDLDQNGTPGTVALAQVVYDVDDGGTWQALPLQHDPTSGDWTGGAPFSGTYVQYFVEACDTAGNCGFSSNKGRYFDAQPLPAQTGTISLKPDRQPDTQPSPWYTHPVTVTASTTGSGTVTVSVDGGPFEPASGSVTLAGDGAHVVVARSSDGSETTAVFLIDGRGPAVAPAVDPPAPDGTNGWYKSAPTVTFVCTDDLSGVKPGSCLVDGGTSDHVTLGQSVTPQSVSAGAQDNAGNTGTGSISGLEVDLTDPAVPVVSGIQNGQHYTASSLPPASVISCTSTDAISGLAGCAITGYSATAGPHVLTATATDNAGRTRTATLTYTVVGSPLDGKVLLSRLFRIWLLDPATGVSTKLAGSVGPFDDQPARSPDGQKVMFARRSSLLGPSQLWVMNANGSGAKQLTATSGDSGNPRWSRDGSQVAFQSTRPGSKGYDVWIANWNAATSTLSGFVNVTNAVGNDIGPTWSPASIGKLAFASDRAGQFDLYTVSAAGGSPTRITTEPRADFDPAWSPDGTKIAFSSNQAADAGSFEIYLMDASGSGTRRLTTQLGVQRAPYWFTATRLDFTSSKLFGGGIATLDVTTSQPPARLNGSFLGDANPG